MAPATFEVKMAATNDSKKEHYTAKGGKKRGKRIRMGRTEQRSNCISCNLSIPPAAMALHLHKKKLNR